MEFDRGSSAFPRELFAVNDRLAAENPPNPNQLPAEPTFRPEYDMTRARMIASLYDADGKPDIYSLLNLIHPVTLVSLQPHIFYANLLSTNGDPQKEGTERVFVALGCAPKLWIDREILDTALGLTQSTHAGTHRSKAVGYARRLLAHDTQDTRQRDHILTVLGPTEEELNKLRSALPQLSPVDFRHVFSGKLVLDSLNQPTFPLNGLVPERDLDANLSDRYLQLELRKILSTIVPCRDTKGKQDVYRYAISGMNRALLFLLYSQENGIGWDDLSTLLHETSLSQRTAHELLGDLTTALVQPPMLRFQLNVEEQNGILRVAYAGKRPDEAEIDKYWQDLYMEKVDIPGKIVFFGLVGEIIQDNGLGQGIMVDIGSSAVPYPIEAHRGKRMNIDRAFPQTEGEKTRDNGDRLNVKANLSTTPVEEIFSSPGVAEFLGNEEGNRQPFADLMILANVLNYQPYRTLLPALLRHLKIGGWMAIMHVPNYGAGTLWNTRRPRTNKELLSFLRDDLHLEVDEENSGPLPFPPYTLDPYENILEPYAFFVRKTSDTVYKY